MFKDEARRWLRALKIAKIIFEDEGYHTVYLEGIEKFIRRRIMYRPRIREEYRPVLLKISASKGIPMTRLVNEIIESFLDENRPKESLSASFTASRMLSREASSSEGAR